MKVVFGRQEAAERPGSGNDGHWAGLFGPGGSCVAVGPTTTGSDEGAVTFV